VRLDAGHIGEAEGRDVGPQARIGAIAGVHQHDTARDAGLKGRSDLVERDLRLGAEHEIIRNASLAPANGIG